VPDGLHAEGKATVHIGLQSESRATREGKATVHEELQSEDRATQCRMGYSLKYEDSALQIQLLSSKR
jgi:hypothetical protein